MSSSEPTDLQQQESKAKHAFILQHNALLNGIRAGSLNHQQILALVQGLGACFSHYVQLHESLKQAGEVISKAKA